MYIKIELVQKQVHCEMYVFYCTRLKQVLILNNFNIYLVDRPIFSRLSFKGKFDSDVYLFKDKHVI